MIAFNKLNNLKLLLPLAPDCERDRIITRIEELEATVRTKQPTLTIHEIKRLTARTSPYFLDRSTLEFFGQRMRDFTVAKQPDGRYKISAPMRHWEGDRMRGMGETVRYFNPATNELERE